ncbi:hypothetical protein KGY47_00235 [Candidatus Bipolaricaulota bacterium]|nr:hypothetical protein [Candidatus Bipolaricaulota bacterium]
MPEAVSLFSGSLSSSISTELVVKNSRLERVIILTLRSPFFDHYDRIKELATELWPNTQFRSKSLKRKTKHIGALGERKFPGKNSYCSRCKATLLRTGKNFLNQVEADFLVSGEVAGGNTQTNARMNGFSKIDKLAGVEGLVYRPLASSVAPESLPEKEERWISSRARELEGNENNLNVILEKWGLGNEEDFFNAEERCKLTKPRFRSRLKNLMEEESFNVNDLSLLDFDSYYKIPPDTKVVLGEGSEEKRELHNYFLPKDLRVYLPTCEGPMALVRSRWRKKSNSSLRKAIKLAARIAASKSCAGKEECVPVKYRFEHDNETYRMDVFPLDGSKLDNLRL